MCVRYRLSSTEEEVAEFFEAELREELHPRYNIAPSQQAPVIRQAECGRVIANVGGGHRAILGQGHFDWLQSDQRLQREDDRGTGLPRLLD